MMFIVFAILYFIYGSVYKIENKNYNCDLRIAIYKIQITTYQVPINYQYKMANGEYRHVWRILVRNFINSLKPRQIQGNEIGKDYIGNKYYEVPANPSSGKRKPSRWYDPPKGQDFQDPIPAEWEAWLRMRRQEPPSEEEVAKNLAIAEMKKINAAKLEKQRLAEGGSLPAPAEKGHESFPSYEEYHGGDPENKYKK